MNISNKHIELLAPAGNMVALHAAVAAGADAVYLGMGEFNARRGAENFTAESLKEACAYAHLRGVRVYVTMNTIVFAREMQYALDSARQAWKAGADAFIVQDLGFASRLHEIIPDAPLHASTQMNIHSATGLETAALLGCERVTLARELSIEEIAYLCDVASQLGMSIETFAHGAICVCYSGQCLMSSMIGGRSANRGTCAQPCRMAYDLCEQGKGNPIKTPGEHILSPRDLCSIGLVPQLVKAGVASLKIEGRMKSPEYVSSVVGVYRDVIDRVLRGEGANPTEEEERSLAQAFSRGFSSAYLEHTRNNDMMGYQRPNNRGVPAGRIARINATAAFLKTTLDVADGDVFEVWTSRGRYVCPLQAVQKDKNGLVCLPLDGSKDARGVHQGDRVFRVRSAEAAFKDDAHEPRIPVDGVVHARIGQPLSMEFCLAEGPVRTRLASQGLPADAIGRAQGDAVEPARTRAVSEEDICAHVDRLGQTPFSLRNLIVDLDEGAGLGFSTVHNVRAQALEELQKALLPPLGNRITTQAHAASPADPIEQPEPEIAAFVANPACARAARKAGATLIYVSALNYKRGAAMMQGCATDEVDQAGYPKQCIVALPTVAHDQLDATRETARDFDVWEYVKPGHAVFVDNAAALLRADDLGALPEVGPHVPLVNSDSLELAARWGARRIWLSPELTLRQIEDLTRNGVPVPLGITIMGAQELMVTEHCVLMSQGPCNEDCPACARRKKAHYLKDRKGYQFPVVTDLMGRSHIYNSVQLDTAANLPELIDAGVSTFMVDATLLNAEQTAQAVGRAAKALSLAQAGQSIEKANNATTGHLFRGVQ